MVPSGERSVCDSQAVQSILHSGDPDTTKQHGAQRSVCVDLRSSWLRATILSQPQRFHGAGVSKPTQRRRLGQQNERERSALPKDCVRG